MKNLLIAKAIVLAATLSASVSYAGSGYGTQKKNIAEIAIENGNFTTLVEALKCTGLDAAVTDPKANLTVFAPTDAAFQKKELNAGNICSKFSKDDLKNILLYHVAGKKIKSPSVVNGTDKKIEMLNGGFIMPEGKGSLVIVANKSKASVAIPDVMASNGIIHAIDDVLLP